MPLVVSGYSVDMDDCLLPYWIKQPADVFDHHTALFEQIRSDPNKKYFYMGSRRQSYDCDTYNSKKLDTPLAIPLLILIAKHTGCILNKLLFADIARITKLAAAKQGIWATNEPRLPGYEFDQVIAGLNEDTDAWERAFCYESLVDTMKPLLVYTQIHNLAKHEPNADKIEFHFYDDFDTDAQRPILMTIYNFYQKYPDLLPSHVTLYLYHYFPEEMERPALRYIVKGTGTVHHGYYDAARWVVTNEYLYNRKKLDLNHGAIAEIHKEIWIDMGTGPKTEQKHFRHEPGVGLDMQYFNMSTYVEHRFCTLWSEQYSHLDPQLFQEEAKQNNASTNQDNASSRSPSPVGI